MKFNGFEKCQTIKSNIEYQTNATDSEIRDWMDAEIKRLGENFKGFEITWHRNEFVYWVEMWSETKNPPTNLQDPHGRHFNIGEVVDKYGIDAIGIIQHEGRKIYNRLKKDYPVHRDLRRA